MKEYFIRRNQLFTELYEIDGAADEVRQSTHRLRMFFSTGQEDAARKEIQRLIEISSKIQRTTAALQKGYDFEGMAKMS